MVLGTEHKSAEADLSYYAAAVSKDVITYRLLLEMGLGDLLAPQKQNIDGVHPSWISDGLRLDDLLWQSVQEQTTSLAVLEIFVEVFRQIIQLIEKNGLLLDDRNIKNIFIVPYNQPENSDEAFVYKKGGHWKVKHVDLDTIDLQGEGAPKLAHSQRTVSKVPVVIRSPEIVATRLANFLRDFAFEIRHNAKELIFQDVKEIVAQLISQLNALEARVAQLFTQRRRLMSKVTVLDLTSWHEAADNMQKLLDDSPLAKKTDWSLETERVRLLQKNREFIDQL